MIHNCKDTLCTTPHYPEPIDTGFTDETIPIECAECSTEITGVEAMRFHILEIHPEYSATEALHFANVWAQDAYDAIGEAIANEEPENEADKDYGD